LIAFKVGHFALDPHSQHSSRREKILEASFIGGLLSELWRREMYDVEILRSDVDAAGYDLVLSTPNGDRHIQLKSCLYGGKVASWPINGKLVDKASGCVIVIIVDRSDLSAKGYLWFGNVLGAKCQNVREGKRTTHTKGDSTGKKSARLDSFRLTKAKFTKVDSFSGLANLLLS
jgi:hypothetical protein